MYKYVNDINKSLLAFFKVVLDPKQITEGFSWKNFIEYHYDS